MLSKRPCAQSDSDPSIFLEMLNKKIFRSEWVVRIVPYMVLLNLVAMNKRDDS